jgi:F-type H+-transporting ATPase subunit a
VGVNKFSKNPLWNISHRHNLRALFAEPPLNPLPERELADGFSRHSMRLIQTIILAVFVLAASGGAVNAADAQGALDKVATDAAAAVKEGAQMVSDAAEKAAHGHEEHHGLPPAAPVVFELGFFKVNNSMVITWIVAIGLILMAQAATRNLQKVPAGLQNFWEWMVESLHGFLESIVGAELVKKTFWFFATIFIFILFTNWFGLIPGVGTIGWGTPDASGHMHHLSAPILRGGNADLNMTSAMALTFFACWLMWSVQANGVGGFFKHIFGYSGDATGGMKAFLILVFMAVGLLEVISIAFRPVSLSFRLFGNIFAGENLLEAMAVMGGKWFGWLVPLPFYFMELIVGLVQALVFMLLTAIFTSLMCQHGDGHEGHAEHGEKAHH